MSEVVGSVPTGNSGSSASGIAPEARDSVQVASTVKSTGDSGTAIIAGRRSERPSPSQSPKPLLGPRKSIVPNTIDFEYELKDDTIAAESGTATAKSDTSATGDRSSSRMGVNVAASETGERPHSRATGDRPSSRESGQSMSGHTYWDPKLEAARIKADAAPAVDSSRAINVLSVNPEPSTAI